MYVHDIDPFLLQFSDSFGIRWYGLSYLAGFFLGYLSIIWMSKRSHICLKDKKSVSDFITWMALGTILGGRLGYCLFYRPELFIDFSSDFPFWGALAIHKGGMSSHGGILGVIVTCFLYSRTFQKPFLHLVDLTVFGGSLGFFFGRLANFINGELYGRICDESFFLAMKFPSEMHLWVMDFSKFKENLRSLSEVVPQIGISSSNWLRSVEERSLGEISQGIQRLLEAIYIKGHKELAQSLEPFLNPRYPSQIFQALMEGLFVFLILGFLWKKPRRAGWISAAFGISYAFFRFVGERFRLPDFHVGLELFQLTRGQWLSLGMFFLAILLLIFTCSQRNDKKEYGGWLN